MEPRTIWTASLPVTERRWSCVLCLQISDAISDATRAISARDAPSLAVFFRNLFDPAASRAGPQHVCLKRAFALLESRWSLDAEEGAYQLPTTGHHEPPVPFGESFLSPEVFVSVVAFLDVPQTMQSARTSKAWWRNGGELERFQPFVLECSCVHAVLRRFVCGPLPSKDKWPFFFVFLPKYTRKEGASV